MTRQVASSSPVYMNHAGTTWPKPHAVQAAVSEATAASPSSWADQFEHDHRRISKFFGVDDKSRILLTPGCTSALSLAIADLPWSAGDRVITSGFEHHALQRPLMKLSQTGVQLCVIPPSTQSVLDLEKLEQELARGNVRLVAISHVSNVTGDIFPIEEIRQLAHQHGALLLIDGAQAAGLIDIDLPNSGIDLFCFGGHKAMHGIWGIGGLFVAPHVEMDTPAATCEIDVSKRGECGSMPGYCDGGSVDRIALRSLSVAIDWLEDPGRQDRLKTIRQQIEILRTAVQSIPGVIEYGHNSVQERIGTIAFNVSDLPSSTVARELDRRGVVVAYGLQCAPHAHQVLGTDPNGVIRLSIGATTTNEEVSQAAQILPELDLSG